MATDSIKKLKIIIVSAYYSIWDNIIFSRFNPAKIILHRKIRPYTMVSSKGLRNAYALSEEVEKSRLPGAFVECGVWKGGCSAMMAYVSGRYGSKRKFWLFDSFVGLPEPSKKDGKKASEYASYRDAGKLNPINKCVAKASDVNEIFSKLGINMEDVVIKKWWFQKVLPLACKDIGPIAILRFDGDWYESAKICLKCLFDNVVSGGYVIIDDYYWWDGSKKAVDEFLKSRNLKPKMNKVDYNPVYFKK